MAIIQLTDQNFTKVIQNHETVLVDFWAEWCPPCRVLSPILDELDLQMEDQITIAKVNADENPQLVERYQVMSIPTLLLIQEGQEIKKQVGVSPLDELKQWVAS